MGLRSIYAKTVRDSRRAALLVGLVGGGFMVAAAAPYGTQFATAETRALLVAQTATLPAVLRGLLGEPINIDLLGGFLSWRVGNSLPVILGLWSVLTLSGTLAGEASKGSLDLLASTPTSRRSIALQKVAGHVTTLVAAMMLMTLLTWVAGRVFGRLPGDDIDLPSAAGFAMLTGLLMLTCGAAAFAVGPIVGRTRAAAVGLVTLFGGYLIASYASLSPTIDGLSPLSWFAWTTGHRPLAGATDWPAVGLLAAVCIALLGAGVLAFERRDLGAAPALRWLRLPSLPAGIRGPFIRQFADRFAVAMAWGLGIGLYGVLIAASAKAFAASIATLPQIGAMIRLIYPDIDIGQPSGLLQLTFFGFGALMTGLAGATLLAGWSSDEGQRRLDLVLSTPLSRVRWALASGVAVLAAVGVATVVFALLVALAVASAGGDAAQPLIGMLILGLCAAGYTSVGFALGGSVRSSMAAPVAATLVIVTFLLDTLGTALDLPDPILDLSLYRHIGQPLVGIIEPVGVAIAIVMTVGGLLVGAWGLQRRDVGR